MCNCDSDSDTMCASYVDKDMNESALTISIPVTVLAACGFLMAWEY